MIRLGLCLLGKKDYRGKMLFSSHYTKDTYNQNNLPLFMVILIMFKIVFVRFPHCQVNYFFPIFILYSVERGHFAQSGLK